MLRQRVWPARLAIAMVMVWNVECASAFLAWPARYAPGFELHGTAGEAVVRGLGILFLMWNVPHAVALWHPVRHRVSLFEALVMQGIGLVGETALLASLSAGHAVLRSTVLRFILFDGFGLALLAVALWLVRRAAVGASGARAAGA